jgi:hypothetical protein
MKKGLFTLSAGIIAATFAFAAFAQDAKPADAPKPAGAAFTFSISGQASASAYQAVYEGANGDPLKGDFSESRVRPEFKLSNGTSEFSMRFEIDATHGEPASGKRNLDTKNVEIAWFYFKSQVLPVQGLSLQGGFAPVDYGFWYADNIGMFGANFDAGIAKINIGYHKLYEAADPTYKSGAAGSQLKDADFWGINAEVKVADLTVSPMFAYLSYGKNTPITYENQSGKDGVQFINGTGIMLGTKVKGKVGPASLYFIGQYAQGKQKEDVDAGIPEDKLSGFALHIAPTIDVASLTVGAFGTYVSGDKPTTDDKTESFTALCLDGVAGGGASKTMLLEDNGMVGGANSSNYTGARVRGKNFGIWAGYILAGVTASAKIGIYKPTVVVAWGQTAQKITATYDKKDLGIEFDLYNTIELSPGTNLEIDLGYLKTGKAYEYAGGKKVNAYVVSAGLQQKM